MPVDFRTAIGASAEQFIPRESWHETSSASITVISAAGVYAAGTAAPIIYSLVANGKSSGQSLELQVYDPSGRTQNADLPEGIVFEPVKRGAARPVAETAGAVHVLTQPLEAYCVDFAKLPPDAGTLYRIAPPSVQEKFRPIVPVLQAGRELTDAGRLTPDSEKSAYETSIQQYALWAAIQHWDQQQFGRAFVEKTKENAAAANVKWTRDTERVVTALIPGRWRDISMVMEEAYKLSGGGARSSAPSR